MNQASLPFTPSRDDPAALRARTVGRDDLTASIVDRIDQAASGRNRIHTLLIGPRGSGKTHLVEAVLHDLGQRPGSKRLYIARLDEDMVGVATYADLLVSIAEKFNADGLLTATATEFRQLDGDPERQRVLREAVGDRVLVLVLENLGRLFDSIDLAGQRSLRAWVEGDRDIVVLATTPLLDASVTDRSAPWFGSFVTHRLPDLTPEQGRDLLLALQGDDEELVDYLGSDEAIKRIQALHHLAGGSPRIWTIAARCITIRGLDELIPTVEAMLEQLVPYYQERLWGLAKNEQKLVVQLARDSSSTVRELAATTGMDSRTAAKALERLENARWVLKNKLPGLDQRLSYYQLREPLLRHHLDYRRSGRGTLGLIVETLKVWFDKAALVRFLGQPSLAEGSVPNNLLARSGVAAYTAGLGDAPAALAMSERLLADAGAVLEADDVMLLSIRLQHAFLTFLCDRPQLAVDMYDDLLTVAVRALGDDHRITRQARSGRLLTLIKMPTSIHTCLPTCR